MMTFTREEAHQQLIEKAWQDAEFKAALIKDTKATIEHELDIVLPQMVNIQVVEESAETQYLVIPKQQAESAELTDADLDLVEGGCLYCHWFSMAESTTPPKFGDDTPTHLR